jgi:hypothetical protein
VLDRIVAAGLSWIRIDFLWDQVETEQDHFDWSTYDAVVAEAAARGLTVYATIDSTPGWATDGPPGTGVPRDPEDFYDICYRAARRYRGRVQAWGMWNEPNLPRFFSGGRREYVETILRPGSAAVRAADPGAQVCGPELATLQSSHWEDWLSEVIGEGGDAIDVVTAHVYPDGSNYASVRRSLTIDGGYPWEPRAVRTVLKAAGWTDRPFWLTETGFNTATLSNEASQGTALAGLLVDLLDGNVGLPWLGNVFVYEISDDPRYPDQAFGLLGPPPELAPKPGYDAVRFFIDRNEVDDARVVQRTGPPLLAPMRREEVSVTVRNTGTTVWSDAGGYVLAPFGDADEFSSGVQRLDASEEVTPGQEHTFTFTVTAPYVNMPSDQPLTAEWRMRREGSRWFGQMARLGIAVTFSPAPHDLYVPAAAHTQGLRGTRWHTDLELHNLSSVTTASATVALLEQGEDNSFPRTVVVSVPGGGSQRWSDALASLFGFSGVGALRVTTSANVRISARTYTDKGAGTAGQLIPEAEPATAVTPGTPATLLGLSRSADRSRGFRTDLGFVSASAFALEVEADLYDGDAYLGTVARRLAPYGVLQLNDVFALLTEADVADGVAIVRCASTGGALLAYASVVDNRSGDPVHVIPVLASDETQVLVATAHNSGLNGTRWRTDVVLANLGEEPALVTARFLPAAGAPREEVLPVQAGAVVRLADAVGTLFGANGPGAIELTPRGSPIAVAARTYNDAAGGTFGQGVPVARLGDAAGEGQVVRLTHLSRSAEPAAGFRTNLGAINVSASALTVEVDLRHADGSEAGRLTFPLAPFQWRQLTDVFGMAGAGDVADGYALVRTASPSGRFLAYASVVDNVTGDPYLVPGW